MFPNRKSPEAPESNIFLSSPPTSRIHKQEKKAKHHHKRSSPERPILFHRLLFMAVCAFHLLSCVEGDKSEFIFSGRTFAATGEIIQIDSREDRVRVAHGDIEEFMGPMTMWFETEPPATPVLKNLRSGDRIRFELREVTNGPSVIFRIYKLH